MDGVGTNLKSIMQSKSLEVPFFKDLTYGRMSILKR